MVLTTICLVVIFLLATILPLILWKQSQENRSSLEKITQQLLMNHSQGQQEVARLAQSAVSATTEATTRLSVGQLDWSEKMVLGRESNLPTNSGMQENNDSERQPIPGIETLEGLPQPIRETLERERQEDMRRLSERPDLPFDIPSASHQRPPTNGRVTRSPNPYPLTDTDLGLPSRPESWMTE